MTIPAGGGWYGRDPAFVQQLCFEHDWQPLRTATATAGPAPAPAHYCARCGIVASGAGITVTFPARLA